MSMAKERSQFQRKLDSFFRSLFFEESGKPKSASLLYAFLLAFLFLLVYVGTYLLLLGPLESWLSTASVPVRNAVEYAVPALAGSAVCILILFALGEKKYLALEAYVILAVLLVFSFLVELLLIDWSDAKTEYGLFMVILGIPALLSVLSGGIPALLVYARERRKRADGAQKPFRPGA